MLLHSHSKATSGDLLLVDELGNEVYTMLTKGHFQVSSLLDSFFGLFAHSCHAHFNTQVFFIQPSLNNQHGLSLYDEHSDDKVLTMN